jgi:hypothetical protein
LDKKKRYRRLPAEIEKLSDGHGRLSRLGFIYYFHISFIRSALDHVPFFEGDRAGQQAGARGCFRRSAPEGVAGASKFLGPCHTALLLLRALNKLMKIGNFNA